MGYYGLCILRTRATGVVDRAMPYALREHARVASASPQGQSRHRDRHVEAPRVMAGEYGTGCVVCCVHHAAPLGLGGVSRAMAMLFSLPPHPVVERGRDIRQVARLWWAIARHTRAASRRLQEQATRLRVSSQTLRKHHLYPSRPCGHGPERIYLCHHSPGD